MKNLIGKGKYTINVTYTPLIKLSRVLLRVAHQAALSIASSRQEYWSGLPFPTPGDIPLPGIKLMSFMSPALADRFFTISATWEAPWLRYRAHIQ